MRDRFTWREPRPLPYALMVGGVIGILALAIVVLLTMKPVWAHDWYTGLKDPISNGDCCGGDDCAEIPDEAVTPVPGGYHVKIVFKGVSIDEVIPNKRAMPAKQGAGYHLCVNPYTNQVQCFFFPAPSF